jgi:MYXO-CTERM domain-containing protein
MNRGWIRSAKLSATWTTDWQRSNGQDGLAARRAVADDFRAFPLLGGRFMRTLTRLLSVGLLAGSSLVASTARAATGTCDVSPGDTGASEMACVNAIAKLGANTVIDDIFRDSNGKTADQLIYGKLIDPYGGYATPTAANGCPQANSICNGNLVTSQWTPAVICENSSHDFNTVAGYVNTLDWKYANPVRLLNNHGLQGAPFDKCPNWGASTSDGSKEGYFPWEGMVFDLGGPSNKVALFPVNDHGPQPCESVEYTVYLTNNPLSRDVIDNPTTTGADPNKWNRAKLSALFLEGWKKANNASSQQVTIPDPNNAANTITYTIEADSFTSVWSLPCGINFRYVGIIAGNDGKDLPECNFDSFDAEIDAVAGLTESGAGVCPDADKDGYVDCNCPTAPPAGQCDCNDSDPAVHPGAPEPCDAPDLNCDGMPGACSGDLVCYQSVCLPTCSTKENSLCPAGSTCSTTPQGQLCVPQDCTSNPSACPAGTVCSNNTCVPACDQIVCPGTQVCKDGSCVDPCMGVQCLPPQICDKGTCVPPCNCFAADVGCVNQPGTVCDSGNTNVCVDPMCQGKMCAAGEHCDPATGTCVGFCNPSVVCPMGEKCKDTVGCVPLCTDVTCQAGFECNPQTGMCEDSACKDVTCLPPQVCMGGNCVDPGSGGSGGMGTGGAPGTTSSTGGAPNGGGGNGGGNVGEKGKCGCRVPGDSSPPEPIFGLLVLAGLSGLGARRARRRSR